MYIDGISLKSSYSLVQAMSVPEHAVEIAKAQEEGRVFKAGWVNGWDWGKMFGYKDFRFWFEADTPVSGTFVLAEGDISSWLRNDPLSFEHLEGDDYLVVNHRVGNTVKSTFEKSEPRPGIKYPAGGGQDWEGL